MYADRYARTGIRPGPLSVAIGLNGAILVALIFSAPEIGARIDIPRLKIVDVVLPPDPPPVPEIKHVKVQPEQRSFDPPPPLRPTPVDQVAPTRSEFILPAGPTGAVGGTEGGTGPNIIPYDPPHVPTIVGAQPDPRYADAFQPDYPPGERRLGNEGRVTVRVLIGIDGRVKQVELVRAASEQFFAVTKRQALQKWRFKPATRDGIPQEEWRTMSVSFVMNGDD